MTGDTDTSMFDVAKYIFENLAKFEYSSEHPIDQMSLYKLLWFCQGWHYFVTNKPLFKESFEARAFGPVPKAMWDVLNGKRYVRQNEIDRRGNLENLGEFSRKIIDKVVKFYSQFDACTLSNLAHQCDPWKNYATKGSVVIPNEEIRKFFREKREFV